MCSRTAKADDLRISYSYRGVLSRLCQISPSQNLLAVQYRLVPYLDEFIVAEHLVNVHVIVNNGLRFISTFSKIRSTIVCFVQMRAAICGLGYCGGGGLHKTDPGKLSFLCFDLSRLFERFR